MIPRGGLSLATGLWVDMPDGKFLPADKMADDFRDRFLTLLQRAFDQGKLRGEQASPRRFRKMMDEVSDIRWVTYASPLSNSDNDDEFSAAASERTVNYLARYANRAPISNNRLISMEDGYVSFTYKDYREEKGKQEKVERITVEEFIRRFLLHVMPSSKRSSRNCGYLGNNRREATLAAIREQLKDRQAAADACAADAETSDENDANDEELEPIDEVRRGKCPHCKKEALEETAVYPRPTIQQIFIMPWKDVLAEDAVVPPRTLAPVEASFTPLVARAPPEKTPQLPLPFS